LHALYPIAAIPYLAQIEGEDALLFVAICIDKPNHLQTRLDTRPAHLDYLSSLKSRLKLAGPFLGADHQTSIGSLLIYDVADEKEARTCADNDPFAEAGLFASVDIKPWRQGFGAPLA
jgi:uncharacterized protein YciI